MSAAEPEIAADGRFLRGQENRRRIVAAMVELVGGGNLSPSAEEVAVVAKVGLRTVFRHFDDMDDLYREISAGKWAELQPLADAPLTGADWRSRLDHLIDRRATLFEKMLPFKTAGDLRRHRSKFLQAEHEKLVAEQARILAAALPAALVADTLRFAALNLALSFESWRRLRLDQLLPPDQAGATMKFAAQALTRDFSESAEPQTGGPNDRP